MTSFHIGLFGAQDASGFRCGIAGLDAWLKRRAAADLAARKSACYVAVEAASGRLAGFYTLSAAGLLLSDVPPELKESLGDTPALPAARIGRLAVDVAFQGRHLGSALLVDAMKRALGTGIKIDALLATARTAEAKAFYGHHGFERLRFSPGCLAVPAATLAALLGEEKAAYMATAARAA